MMIIRTWAQSPTYPEPDVPRNEYIFEVRSKVTTPTRRAFKFYYILADDFLPLVFKSSGVSQETARRKFLGEWPSLLKAHPIFHCAQLVTCQQGSGATIARNLNEGQVAGASAHNSRPPEFVPNTGCRHK
jgi:hypothetical protein